MVLLEFCWWYCLQFNFCYFDGWLFESFWCLYLLLDAGVGWAVYFGLVCVFILVLMLGFCCFDLFG